MLVVPATQEDEAEESLQPRKFKASLGNMTRTFLLKRREGGEIRKTKRKGQYCTDRNFQSILFVGALFLKWGLTELPRLTSNSQTSHLSLPSS
jgi:hypothetical protein